MLTRPGLIVCALTILGSSIFGLYLFADNFTPKANVLVEHPPGYELLDPEPYAAHPDEAWSMCHAPIGDAEFVFSDGNSEYSVTRKIGPDTEVVFIHPKEDS